MDYKKLYENQSRRMEKLQEKYDSIKEELKYDEIKKAYLDNLLIELNDMQDEMKDLIFDLKKERDKQEEIRAYMLKQKAHFDREYNILLKQAKLDFRL